MLFWIYSLVTLSSILMMTVFSESSTRDLRLAEAQATSLLIWHHACLHYIDEHPQHTGLIMPSMVIKRPRPYQLNPSPLWQTVYDQGRLTTHVLPGAGFKLSTQMAQALSRLTAHDRGAGFVEDGLIKNTTLGPFMSAPAHVPPGVALMMTCLNPS